MNRTLAIAGVAVGAAFIYDGIHGRKLWDDLLSVIRGQPLAPDPSSGKVLTNLASGVASADSQFASTAANNVVSAVRANVSARQLQQDPPDLVQLTKLDGTPTGQYLKTEAAAAFQAAQRQVGKDIPLTTAYRTLASETIQNKQDPHRFPIPNFHTAALAIDVWAGNGAPGWLQSPAASPQVVAALEANGWQRFAPNDPNEFMHWSFGGRG